MLGQVGILLLSRIDKYLDPFYNMVLEGVDRALERLSYHISFVKTLREISATAQAQRLLNTFDFKGLILLGAADSDSIAVTGFDNIPDADFTFPPLTTARVHKVLLGELAAERLVKRIENPVEVYLKINAPTSLVIRQSCGAREPI